MKKSLLAFIVVGLLFAGIGLFFGLKQAAPEKPGIDASALFSRSLPDMDGQAQALSQWKDKTLILNFWATWCAPCVQEMPDLSALQQELKDKNIQIIGIGIDSPSNVKEFAAKYKISYPLYVSGMEGTELSRQFGNQAGGLPFTVLISRDGKIRKTYLGKLNMAELRRDLSKL